MSSTLGSFTGVFIVYLYIFCFILQKPEMYFIFHFNLGNIGHGKEGIFEVGTKKNVVKRREFQYENWDGNGIYQWVVRYGILFFVCFFLFFFLFISS